MSGADLFLWQVVAIEVLVVNGLVAVWEVEIEQWLDEFTARLREATA